MTSDSPPASAPGQLDPGAASDVDHGPASPWLACFVPMLVFLLGGILEPSREGGGLAATLGIGYGLYPSIYALRIAATLAALAAGWGALRPWLGRPRLWPFVLGIALVVPWVVLSKLQRDTGWFAGDTGRVGFNPFELYAAGSAASWAYVALRGLGLVVVVPIVEELFLRGFLLRFVLRERFWLVPFGAVTAATLATCGLYAVGSHPAEALAAVVWFGAVTWLAWRTRRPMDCILTHAGTNLALGGYVLATGDWWLL